MAGEATVADVALEGLEGGLLGDRGHGGRGGHLAMQNLARGRISGDSEEECGRGHQSKIDRQTIY